MKRVTASQARRHWFRLLDEIAEGEVVVIERKGRRIVLRREEEATEADSEDLPDYGSLLRARDAERADLWGWSWESESGDVTPAEKTGAGESRPADGPAQPGPSGEERDS